MLVGPGHDQRGAFLHGGRDIALPAVELCPDIGAAVPVPPLQLLLPDHVEEAGHGGLNGNTEILAPAPPL